MNTPFDIDPLRIRADFHRLSRDSAHYTAVSKTLGENLLQRLYDLQLQPQVIVDLGAGNGIFTSTLKEHYPQSQLLSVDYAFSRLHNSSEASEQQSRNLKGEGTICAEAAQLPLATGSVDVVFCHMLLHWCAFPEMIFAEIQRILKKNGVMLFSVLAPDSLQELRQAFETIMSKNYICSFTDMHHWGDHLQKNQFKDPVVDVEYFHLYYKNFTQLMSALRQGPTYLLKDMNKGLITQRQWKHLEKAYENYRDEYGLALTLEVVYGIAFGKGMAQQDNAIKETHIPIKNVQRKR